MKKYFTFLFCLLMTTACTSKEPNMTSANPYHLKFTDEKLSYLTDTDIPFHFNPHPQKAYEITISIKDSPMPLLPYAKPIMLFWTESCKYESGPFVAAPHTEIEFPLTKVDENTYKLIFVQDAILEEDYGLTYEGKKQGVCHWRTNGASVGFSPTGKEQARNIVVKAANSYDHFDEQPAVQTLYFPKDYVTTEAPEKMTLSDEIVSIVATGFTEEEVKKQGLKKSDLFTITISLKKLP